MQIKITFFYSVLFAMLFPAQTYISLDSLKTEFKVSEYNLDTSQIYSIEKNIKINNVFIGKDKILLLSVMPNLKESKLINVNSQNWDNITLEKIEGKIFSNGKLLSKISEWLIFNSPQNKTLEYKLVININGQLKVSQLCLMEVFILSDLKPPFSDKSGVINIHNSKITINKFYNEFKRQIPDEEFIMDVRNAPFSYNLDSKFRFKNYLSQNYKIANEDAYQFWTFDGWWTHDGYDEHRGIDRFVYIPGKGIIGGSYDFYFNLKPKISSNNYFTESKYKLWDNIINEKIIIADEFIKDVSAKK